MAAKKESATLTVEEKLRALYDLQLVHSRIDKLRSVRGELPLEVMDLEDEISGLQKRIDRVKGEVDDLESEINDRKNQIKQAQTFIKKYEEQQMNVRNSREYDAITKEVEFQNLEIQLAEKRIREYQSKIDNKCEVLTESTTQLAERLQHLEHKKAELDTILAETQAEEDALNKLGADLEGKIEERLLNAYHRIRENSKNGMAVVTIERGATGGSFFTIPPQQQLEIAQRKKITTSEHCGRILVDPELASEEEERMAELFQNL